MIGVVAVAAAMVTCADAEPFAGNFAASSILIN